MPARPEHHPFVKSVAAALRARCGLRGEGAKLLLAVSGGADSVALLRALAALAPRRGWRLVLAVGHVQHHLRGEASEGDARFVAELAERLDLPLLRADLDAPPPGENLEAWARRARYAALAEMAGALEADAVLTAHHADDQLETLLMRLLRGASVRGLAGMAWRSRLPLDTQTARSRRGAPAPRHLLLRPMLAVDHGASEAFLRDLGQPWREDHTNADLDRLRARLRHEVLPALRTIRPTAAARAVAAADHLAETARLLDTAVANAAEFVTLVEGMATFSRAWARSLPVAVLSGLVRRLLMEGGVRPDALTRRTLSGIARAIRDAHGRSRRFAFAGGVAVIVLKNEVRVG